MAIQLDTRAVQVHQVNGHGFKSTAGDWLNFSKFANPDDVAMPRVGDQVVVHLDKAGYVRKIETAAPPATPVPVTATSESTSTNVGRSSPAIIQDDRSIVAPRVAILSAAVAILTSGRAATTEEDVVICAKRLERWATR